MSYLIVQILFCLLIAGLIGLVIGWLMSKFKYKEELSKSKEHYKYEMASLKNTHQSLLQDVNNKLMLKDIEMNKANNNWNQKFQELLDEKNRDKNNLDLLDIALEKSENEVKNLKIKLDESENEWQLKVQTLNSENKAIRNDLLFLSSTLKKSKEAESQLGKSLQELEKCHTEKVQQLINDKKTLSSQLKSREEKLVKFEKNEIASNPHLELELDKLNSQWHDKRQIIDEKENSSLKLLKLDLEKAEDKVKKLEMRLEESRNKLSEFDKSKSELAYLKVRLKDANNKFFVTNEEWKKKLANLEASYQKEKIAKEETLTLKSNSKTANNSDETKELVVSLQSKLSRAEHDAKVREKELETKLNECANSWQKKFNDLKESKRLEEKKNVSSDELISQKISSKDNILNETLVKITKVDRVNKHQVKGMKKDRKVRKGMVHKEEVPTTKKK